MSTLRCYLLFDKQKTAYELRISDWSSAVCSSGLRKADEEKSGHDHPCIQREHQPQHAEGIKEHVVLIDLLAPEQVAQPAADQGADAGRDRVRPKGADQADEIGRAHV